MNNSAESKEFIPQSQKDNLEYKFQYACCFCNKAFVTEKICDEHLTTCSAKSMFQDKLNVLEKKLLRNYCDENSGDNIEHPTIPKKINERLESTNGRIDLEMSNSLLCNRNAHTLNSNNDEVDQNVHISSDNIKNVKILAVLNPVETSRFKMINEKTNDSCDNRQDQTEETVSDSTDDVIFCDIIAEQNKDNCDRSPCNPLYISTDDELTITKINSKAESRETSTSNNQSTKCRSVDKNYKWYQKINQPKHYEPEEIIGVYDFYDEEEEKANMEKIKTKEKEKELKEKTCRICNKVFDDPIEVLRHRRKEHQFSKIVMSKEELAPYLNTTQYDTCPLCHKSFGKKVYKSTFRIHLMTHCNNEVYQCEICGQQFKRKHYKKVHESRHIIAPD